MVSYLFFLSLSFKVFWSGLENILYYKKCLVPSTETDIGADVEEIYQEMARMYRG